jgi:hypothetical protein
MRAWIGWGIALALAASAGADVLETRDGRMLEGRYLGGTPQALRFEVAGAVQLIPVESVLALRFDASARTAAPTPAPGEAAAGTPAAAPALARVPAGTRLRVRLDDAIDPRRSILDDRFAGSLEVGLAAGDTPILPVGTRVYGRIADLRATGPVASRLQLELDQLMHRGQLVPIVSGPHQLARADAPGPANAATIPERPEFAAGTLLEFRLLQPLDLPLH